MDRQKHHAGVPRALELGRQSDPTGLADFDLKVELHKTIIARNGTLVQSDGERLIADWLTANGIAFRYDERCRILSGHAVRPDFYLPEFDLLVLALASASESAGGLSRS